MTPVPASRPDVLVVDDEVQIRSVLRYALEESGFSVRDAETGRAALGEIALKRPELIILDIGLPDRPGPEVLKALREFCASPVLVLSVQNNEDSKIEMLDFGADDYLTKPFGTREVLARLRALLRRKPIDQRPVRYTFGTFDIDLASRSVKRSGKLISLTVTEFALLQLLVTHHDRVMTHKEILTEVWGPRSTYQTHYLRMYMMRLRRKLGDDSVVAAHFQTESGVGYRFVSEPES